MPYGDRFRKHRRLMSQVLNSQAIGVYRDFQMNNTKALLKSLLHEPEKFDQHILRFVLHNMNYVIISSLMLAAKLTPPSFESLMASMLCLMTTLLSRCLAKRWIDWSRKELLERARLIFSQFVS